MKRKVILIGLLLILGATAVAAFAFTPRAQIEGEGGEAGVTAVTASAPAFNYQGQLLDAQGDPVTGAVPMTFKLYPTATGGTACWTENHTGGNAVEVVNGRFSVLLGQITPADATCLANDAYLELRINNETLSPRQQLTKAIVSNGSQLGLAIVGEDLSFKERPDRGDIIGPLGGILNLIADNTPLTPDGGGYRGGWIWLSSLDSSIVPGSVRVHIVKDNALGNSPFFDIYRLDSDGAIQNLLTVNESGALTTAGKITASGDLRINPQNTVGEGGEIQLVTSDQSNAWIIDSLHNNLRIFNGVSGGSVTLGAGETVHLNVSGDLSANGGLAVGGYNINLGPDTILRQDGSRTLHLLPWGGSGHAYDEVCIGCGSNANLLIRGNLDLSGSCTASVEGNEVATADDSCTGGSITSGAYIESNLMTAAERRSERITRFTQGDLLCWTAAQQLEKCSQANTALVMGVADVSGKPIVIGAEPVKVIGPVKMGDYLVASDLPGYAIATSNPTFGIVIAQALEDFDGERGLVLAMIRKM